MVKPHQSLKARKYDIDKAMYTLAKMIDWRNGYGANPIDEFGLNHTYNLHNQVLPNFMVDCMALSWRFSGFGT
ncbi:hypothetical protein MKX01_033463 [Papaver californicum]|nr:hypothetical protein MKX01_033463 [Papaver californicum]